MTKGKLKYSGWGLTEAAKRNVIKREVRRMVPKFGRCIKLVQLRHLGYSNVEIGRRHRISRERVRQELEFFDTTFLLLK